MMVDEKMHVTVVHFSFFVEFFLCWSGGCKLKWGLSSSLFMKYLFCMVLS